MFWLDKWITSVIIKIELYENALKRRVLYRLDTERDELVESSYKNI